MKKVPWKKCKPKYPKYLFVPNISKKIFLAEEQEEEQGQQEGQGQEELSLPVLLLWSLLITINNILKFKLRYSNIPIRSEKTMSNVMSKALTGSTFQCMRHCLKHLSQILTGSCFLVCLRQCVWQCLIQVLSKLSKP